MSRAPNAVPDDTVAIQRPPRAIPKKNQQLITRRKEYAREELRLKIRGGALINQIVRGIEEIRAANGTMLPARLNELSVALLHQQKLLNKVLPDLRAETVTIDGGNLKTVVIDMTGIYSDEIASDARLLDPDDRYVGSDE